MTFDEYIQNPMGEKNAVMSNRAMYRSYYQEKLDKIMVREHGKADYKTFRDGNRYLIYIKIPSEKLAEFYYDIIVEFTPPKGEITGYSLDKYNVRFYANDPAFIYTFAHAFKTHNLLIPEFKDKLSKRALKEKADEKNPQDVVGYVKSLYFTYLIMKSRGLFSKVFYTNKYDSNALHMEIMDADQKIEDRQNAAKEIVITRRKEKQKIKDRVINHDTSTDKSLNGKIKNVAQSKKVVRKTMNNISKTKTTKKVGKK